MTTQKTCRRGLSPVAALALRIVKGWIRVVSKGRGGEIRNGVPYTRLKADEVRQQLEADYQVVCSTKTVQRALTSLVAGGHLTRRQLYKHRYNRTYWYSWSDREQAVQAHRPTVVAAANNGSKRCRPPVPDERTQVSSQALEAQIKKSNLAGEQPNSRTALTEESAVRPSGASPRPFKGFGGGMGGRGQNRGLADGCGAALDKIVEKCLIRGGLIVESPEDAGFLPSLR